MQHPGSEHKPQTPGGSRRWRWRCPAHGPRQRHASPPPERRAVLPSFLGSRWGWTASGRTGILRSRRIWWIINQMKRTSDLIRGGVCGRHFVPVVEKLPVGFNLYPLPSFPQDDRLLVWVLTNNRHCEVTGQLSKVVCDIVRGSVEKSEGQHCELQWIQTNIEETNGTDGWKRKKTTFNVEKSQLWQKLDQRSRILA